MENRKKKPITRCYNLECHKMSSCKKKRKNKIKRDSINYTEVKDLYSLMRNDLALPEIICFNPIEKCAEKITDTTLILAKSLISGIKPDTLPEYKKIIPEKTIWPNMGDLNMISGLRAVELFVQTFDRDESLKYCINFLNQKMSRVSSTLMYQVIWSIPSQKQPVPLSTAAMIFYLKSYFKYPNIAPAEVGCTYEFSSQVYTPETFKFREDRLMNIMESKAIFRKNNKLEIDQFL